MAEDDDALAATLAGGTAPAPAVKSGVIPSLLPSTPGEKLAGRYELLGLLGMGGMGSVYHARDVELDEIVALKVLAPGTDPSFLDRFRQEVKLARRVTHRNVARTFDIGEHGEIHFLTMEFVDGEALAKLLEREGALSVSRALSLALELCHGLKAAHAAGVLHRDLKPENALLGRDGRVVITDFGIARAMVDGGSRTQGVILGTPAYMAPEQVEGSKSVDARADLYALGAILFEMVTGRRAWEGDSAISVAAARLIRPAPDPRTLRPTLPTGVADVIAKCMQRAPSDRFADVDQLASRLEQLAIEEAAHAPGTSSSSRGPGSHVPEPLGSSPRVASASGLVGSPLAAKTLAVLPFRNGGPPDDEYLADGLTEDLIDGLSMVSDLRVRSRGAVVHLRGKTGDPRDLGRDLDVRLVVDGSVRRVGESVRVSVRLVSVDDGFQLWAKRFDRPVGEVLMVADEAAEAIATALTVRRKERAHGAHDPEVVDLYLRARHEYHRHWEGANARAVALFEQAAQRAPEDARVLGGLALALLRRFALEGAAAASEAARGREMAMRALAIDPTNAEAHVAAAGVAWGFGDSETAAKEALLAVRANPGVPEGHEYYGRLLLESGRVEEGIARLQVAITLEPYLRGVHGEIARAYALLGDWAKYEATMGPPPSEVSSLNLYWLNRSRFAMWRRDEAELERIEATMMAGPPFEMRAIAVAACTMYRKKQPPDELIGFFKGRPEAGAHTMRRRSFSGQLRAEVGALFNNREEVLSGLRFADASMLLDIAWMDRCPLFDKMRNDPDFLAVYASVRARVDAVLAILPK